MNRQYDDFVIIIIITAVIHKLCVHKCDLQKHSSSSKRKTNVLASASQLKQALISIMVTSNQTFSIKHLNNNFCMTEIKSYWLIISVIMCNGWKSVVVIVFLYFLFLCFSFLQWFCLQSLTYSLNYLTASLLFTRSVDFPEGLKGLTV